MTDLSSALKQLRKQRDQAARTLARIDMAISALGGTGRRISQRGGRRRMSAAARRRIAAAQEARWAKWRKAHRS